MNPQTPEEWAFLFAASGMLPLTEPVEEPVRGPGEEPGADAMTVVWEDDDDE